MGRVSRCARCGDVIGVYEPLVVMEEDGPRHTSVAADPKLRDDQWERYHRVCYAAAFSQRLDLLGMDPTLDPGDGREVRWFIVDRQTGAPAEGQPMDGFGWREEAENVHETVLRGDPRLVVRSARR